MKRPLVLVFLGSILLGFVASCSRSDTTTSPADAAMIKPRYGASMTEVGQRFELAGRAAAANRFELAAFEIGEISELFEELPRAEPPKEGPTEVLGPLADAFLKTHAPELRKAATAKDAAAFAGAFKNAAAACNECHRASGHGFVEIPAELGKAVPAMDPLPAPPSDRGL